MSGWTDYCPDWSSKDKLRLCSVYDALSALTVAVNERGSVLGSGFEWPNVINKFYPVKYYMNIIETRIKTIVPLYVNHTINSGDFTALGTTPMWTWNDILAGDTEIITGNLYSLLDWIYQRYQIINKLKWVIPHVVYLGETQRDYTPVLVSGATPQAACLNAKAAAVANGETSINNWLRVYGYYVAPYNLDAAYAATGKCQYNIAPNQTTPLKATADIYLYADKSILGSNVSYEIFNGCGLFNEGWNKRSIDTEGTTPLSIQIGDLSFPTSEPSIDDVSFGFWIDYNKNRAVIKFDGANGFTFKDW